MNNPNVAPEQLAPLRFLPKLSWLILNDVPVRDAGLEHVQGCTGLRRLSLQNAQITDAGLHRLAGLVELRILHLDDNPIGDAGVEHLHALRRLETLTLRNTRVTPEGVRRLKQAVPAVEVVGVSDRTPAPRSPQVPP